MKAVTANTEQWNLLQQNVLGVRVALTFNAFRDVGVEPILIKGWAAAQNYPKSHVRRPADIDLAVSSDEYQTVLALIREPQLANFDIDLHKGLRQLDTLEWDDVFEHSILIDQEGTAIRVLCPEDHLRVLATHWLIDGGGYKDKLWDIYYAVANRPPDFDWERCLSVVDKNRRDWVICAIAIAHKYLDLPVEDLPFANEVATVPRWISLCIEREWKRKRLEPILTSTHDKRLFLGQIARRLPPNPIRATIEANGDLYGRRRRLYQAQVLRRRAGPFLRDLFDFIKLKMRGSHN